MIRSVAVALAVALLPVIAASADVEGAADHPLITRYPGSEIAWYEVDNHRPYKLAVGPVTGYRAIADWIETEGRVTRIYYALDNSGRTEQEVFLNYRKALEDAGFEILAAGASEANTRGETLYAPTRRTPLHPATLSEGATSLLPGQVRPALQTGDNRRVDLAPKFGIARQATLRHEDHCATWPAEGLVGG